MIKGILVGLALFLVAAGAWIMWLTKNDGPAALDLADRLAGGGAQAELRARGIAFGDERLRLDIWQPKDASAAPRPVVVFVYGGSWASGARASYGFAGRALAAQGFTVVVPDYRLVPQTVFPGFVEDTAAAVAWTQANIARFGGDPARIMLSGHSAGAYNAAMVLLDRKWLHAAGGNADTLRGAALLAAPLDFLPLERGGAAERAMGMVRPLEATQPISFARGDAPPLWLATSDADTTVGAHNSRNLTAAVERLGGRVSLVNYGPLDHSEIIMALAVPFRSKGPVLREMSKALHAMADAPTTPTPAPQ